MIRHGRGNACSFVGIGTLVRVAALTLMIAAAPRGATAAHPVSITEAVVFVDRGKIAVRINVFVEDLYLFHNLQPNRENRLEPADIGEACEAHKAFLLERFQLRSASGELLKGTPVGVDAFTMPENGISLDELMTFSYGFRFEYPLDGPIEFVTVSQNMIDETAGIPAEMQLRVKQEGSESPYYAVLNPGEPVTVRFSWDKPPLSPDASESEWEEWLAARKEETLGITSYSAVYSFIYITDLEVRHEILAPLATLESSVLIPREDEAFLEIAEQPEAAEQIGAYFSAGNPVRVDGEPIKPTVSRIDFYGVDFRDFAQQAPKRRVSMANARAGIILTYPLKRTPDDVEVVWDRFNRYIFSVRAVVYALDKTHATVFSRYGSEQTYRWRNPGRPPLPELEPVAVSDREPPAINIPIPSLLGLLAIPCVAVALALRRATLPVWFAATTACLLFAAAVSPWGHRPMTVPWARPPAIPDSEAEPIFRRLHANLFRAFDYASEDQVYDALSRTVEGDLLRDFYLQIRKRLAMEEQGGALSRIEEVKLVSSRLRPRGNANVDSSDAFDVDATWTVRGTVEHWGHIHARTNQYDAAFRVEPIGGHWKFTRAEILDEERVRFETRIRGL